MPGVDATASPADDVVVAGDVVVLAAEVPDSGLPPQPTIAALIKALPMSRTRLGLKESCCLNMGLIDPSSNVRFSFLPVYRRIGDIRPKLERRRLADFLVEIKNHGNTSPEDSDLVHGGGLARLPGAEDCDSREKTCTTCARK